MESSKNTMDRLSMAKMVYEGLNRERQTDFNRIIATLMAVSENAKEMKKPALKFNREKLDAAKKAKEVKTPAKQKTPRGNINTRGRGRGRGGRGRGGQKRRHNDYFERDSRDNRYEHRENTYESSEPKIVKPEYYPEKPSGSGGDGYRGRGRGGFRGSRGSAKY